MKCRWKLSASFDVLVKVEFERGNAHKQGEKQCSYSIIVERILLLVVVVIFDTLDAFLKLVHDNYVWTVC